MRKTKIISMMLSGVMAISALGSLAVSAEEEKLYTLKELESMSKEEFFALNGAKEDYNYVVKESEEAGYIKFRFKGNALSTKIPYNYAETDEKIYELMGDSIEFTLSSPKSPDDAYNEEGYYQYYWNYICLSNSDYFYKGDEMTEDKYLFVAKAYYCMNQVFTFSYEPEKYGLLGLSAPMICGDANQNNKLDIMDAALIARKVAGRKTDELPGEADYNNDGKIDIIDAARIARAIASHR